MKIYQQISIMLFLFFPVFSAFGGAVKDGAVTAELLSDKNTISAGGKFTVGIYFKMDKHWHTYWVNAGDAGLGTAIEWKLPKGIKAGKIQYPYPKKENFSDMSNYIYEPEVVLLCEMTALKDLKPGSKITIKARADWLMCKEKCVPGGADLSLTLNVADKAKSNPANVKLFDVYRKKLPITYRGLEATAHEVKNGVSLELKKDDFFTGDISKLIFFPEVAGIYCNGCDQKVTVKNDKITMMLDYDKFKFEDSDKVTGLLYNEAGWNGNPEQKALQIDVKVQTN